MCLLLIPNDLMIDSSDFSGKISTKFWFERICLGKKYDMKLIFDLIKTEIFLLNYLKNWKKTKYFNMLKYQKGNFFVY